MQPHDSHNENDLPQSHDINTQLLQGYRPVQGEPTSQEQHEHPPQLNGNGCSTQKHECAYKQSEQFQQKCEKCRTLLPRQNIDSKHCAKCKKELEIPDVLFYPLDGGYGWVIVACSFVLQAISVGLAFSVAVLMVEWLDKFQRSVAITSWIGSINCGLLFGAGPLSSTLTNKFGHRSTIMVGSLLSAAGLILSAFGTSVYLLYVAYGIMCGIGFCMMYIPSVVIVGQYFDRLRPVVMAFTSAGVGAGALAFAPLLRYFVSTYGLTGGLLLEAGIALQGAVMGSLMRPIHYSNMKNFQIKQTTYHIDYKSIFDFTLLRYAKFWLFFFNNILWNVGSLILIALVSDYARECGMDKSQGTILVSVIGLLSLTGRLLASAISVIRHINTFHIYVASNVISGLAIVLFPVKETFMAFCAFSALYGVMFGLQLGMLGTVTADIFGVKRLSNAYGYLMLSNGMGAMLGPPIAGSLYVVYNAYELPYYFGGAVTIFSGLLMLAIPHLQRREKCVSEVLDKRSISSRKGSIFKEGLS